MAPTVMGVSQVTRQPMPFWKVGRLQVRTLGWDADASKANPSELLHEASARAGIDAFQSQLQASESEPRPLHSGVWGPSSDFTSP